jgi:hypothetical protein
MTMIPSMTPAEKLFLRHRAEMVERLRKEAEARGDEEFEALDHPQKLSCGVTAKLAYTSRGAELTLGGDYGSDEFLDTVAGTFYALPPTHLSVELLEGKQYQRYCGPRP